MGHPRAPLPYSNPMGTACYAHFFGVFRGQVNAGTNRGFSEPDYPEVPQVFRVLQVTQSTSLGKYSHGWSAPGLPVSHALRASLRDCVSLVAAAT